MDKKEVKKAWARSVNNKDYKPYKDEKYGNKVPGKIMAEHYLIYNLIRELPEERGFEPIGEGFKQAKVRLGWKSRYSTNINGLLLPFEQTVTADELRELL